MSSTSAAAKKKITDTKANTKRKLEIAKANAKAEAAALSAKTAAKSAARKTAVATVNARTAAKKAAAKSAAAKKSVAKTPAKPVAKKAPAAKQTATKQAAVKKAPLKKAVTKTALKKAAKVTKTPATRAVAKTTAARKAVGKRRQSASRAEVVTLRRRTPRGHVMHVISEASPAGGVGEGTGRSHTCRSTARCFDRQASRCFAPTLIRLRAPFPMQGDNVPVGGWNAMDQGSEHGDDAALRERTARQYRRSIAMHRGMTHAVNVARPTASNRLRAAAKMQRPVPKWL